MRSDKSVSIRVCHVERFPWSVCLSAAEGTYVVVCAVGRHFEMCVNVSSTNFENPTASSSSSSFLQDRRGVDMQGSLVVY